MILSCEEMRIAEAAAIADGVDEQYLMETAAERMALAIQKLFPDGGTAIAFAGGGHNGGDALAIARNLGELDEWTVLIALAGDEEKMKPLTAQMLEEVGALATEWCPAEPLTPESPLILIDGLLGIGAKGPLRECVQSLTRHLNELRTTFHATTFAIDLPTGVCGDTGTVEMDAVVADFTFAIGHVKRGLLQDEALDHVGRLWVIPLEEIVPLNGQGDQNRVVLTSRFLAPMLPRRKFSCHKGQAGRVGIIAGSMGMVGAASLTATGALRGGAGLVTLFVPEEVWAVAASRVPAPVMVRAYQTISEIPTKEFDVLVIGPGLGQSVEVDALRALMQDAPQPCVLDADALNALAPDGHEILRAPRGPRLLTPHPGEMRRLVGETNLGSDRLAVLEAFVVTYPVTLLLKGARTLVGELEKPTAFNSTGNPGMASGGMGDVLAGLCGALLAQGCSTYGAACLATWLLGRSAELATFQQAESVESLCASDLPEMLGSAFTELKAQQS